MAIKMSRPVALYCWVMAMRLSFVVCLAAVRSGRGPYRIVGGVTATKGEFPFLVSIQLRHQNRHFCGGSILHPEAILTAAHCCNGRDPASLIVVAGKLNMNDKDDGSEQRCPVSMVSMHSGYKEEIYLNDICIMRLSKPLIFVRGKVEPVKLIPAESKGMEVAPGEPLFVTGWGLTHASGNIGSRHLMKVSVPTVSIKVCRESYLNVNPITESMICAGRPEGGMDSCNGDSGGPLINSYMEQVGIVSFGLGCARPNTPGVYTRVSHYIDWIKHVSRPSSAGAASSKIPSRRCPCRRTRK